MTETDYTQFRIKEYQFWDLFLHKNQYPYLGRCYAWARRANAAKITDILPEEREELFGRIIPLWHKAVQEIFHHDWPNVAILGNEAPHLHAHLIPRYHAPTTFEGLTFTDPNPKGNYAPYPKKDIPLEILLNIRDQLKTKL